MHIYIYIITMIIYVLLVYISHLQIAKPTVVYVYCTCKLRALLAMLISLQF